MKHDPQTRIYAGTRGVGVSWRPRKSKTVGILFALFVAAVSITALVNIATGGAAPPPAHKPAAVATTTIASAPPTTAATTTTTAPVPTPVPVPASAPQPVAVPAPSAAPVPAPTPVTVPPTDTTGDGPQPYSPGTTTEVTTCVVYAPADQVTNGNGQPLEMYGGACDQANAMAASHPGWYVTTETDPQTS